MCGGDNDSYEVQKEQEDYLYHLKQEKRRKQDLETRLIQEKALENEKQKIQGKFYFFGGRSYLQPLKSMTIDEARTEIDLNIKNPKGLILKAIEEV